MLWIAGSMQDHDENAILDSSSDFSALLESEPPRQSVLGRASADLLCFRGAGAKASLAFEGGGAGASLSLEEVGGGAGAPLCWDVGGGEGAFVAFSCFGVAAASTGVADGASLDDEETC